MKTIHETTVRRRQITNIALIFTLVGVVLLPMRGYSLPCNLLRPSHGFDSNSKEETSKRFKDVFRKRFGGKALGLIILRSFAKQLGFKVPYFEKIGTEIFKGFLEHNSITRERIDEIYAENFVIEDFTKGYYSYEVGPFDAIGVKGYNKEAYKQIKRLVHEGKFTKEQESQLKKLFNTIRKKRFPVIAIRSSSVLEDGEKHQFKGTYHTEFLCFSWNKRKDFKLFKEKIKFIYADIFSPKARDYRLKNNIPDEDEMAIVVQQVIGSSHNNWQGKTKFYPPLSGVTLFKPYHPNATISYVNLGLNTKTVRGEYSYRAAHMTDSFGKTHHSVTFPTLISLSGANKREYDYINTERGLVENSSEDKTVIKFEEYRDDKKRFLSIVKRFPEDVEFSNEFTSKVDFIAKRIKESIGKPFELEWSVDDEAEINLYQLRFSYDVEKFFKKQIEIKVVPDERIIAQSNIVSGHGEIAAPIIMISTTSSFISVEDAFDNEITTEEKCNGYILSVDLNNFMKSSDLKPNADFFYYNFPQMIGLLNMSDEPVPLAAHWSEFFINNNILVVSSANVNQKLLNEVCYKEGSQEKDRISLVKMVVNGLKQRGQVYLPEESSTDKSRSNPMITAFPSQEDLLRAAKREKTMVFPGITGKHPVIKSLWQLDRDATFGFGSLVPGKFFTLHSLEELAQKNNISLGELRKRLDMPEWAESLIVTSVPLYSSDDEYSHRVLLLHEILHALEGDFFSHDLWADDDGTQEGMVDTVTDFLILMFVPRTEVDKFNDSLGYLSLTNKEKIALLDRYRDGTNINPNTSLRKILQKLQSDIRQHKSIDIGDHTEKIINLLKASQNSGDDFDKVLTILLQTERFSQHEYLFPLSRAVDEPLVNKNNLDIDSSL